MQQKEYPLLGLHCAGCAGRAESVLQGLEGMQSASVNLATASAQVVYDETILQPEVMARAIAEAGYQLVVEQRYQDDEEIERLRRAETNKLYMNAAIALASALILMVAMFVLDGKVLMYLGFALATLVMCTAGRGFYQRAYRQFVSGGLGMDALVGLSTLVAYIYSLYVMLTGGNEVMKHVYFESSVMIIAFVLFGKVLEARAKGHTSEAIKRLIGMQPKRVLRINAQGEREDISVYELILGDTILVRAGERIAVDGIVSAGSTYIDESMLTGEALPQTRGEGDKVYAGSINQNGSITVRATALHRDTLLGRIIERVRTAQGSKAPIQRMVDKVASIFVPVIIVLSLITFGLWYYLGGEGALEQALVSMTTVLVIACPCALGLATPTAIMVGIGRAAEEGILIKDAESLELACSVKAIIFDKTGTLTEGRHQLVEVVGIDPSLEHNDILRRLRTLEEGSDHPIARAILSSVDRGYECYERTDWEQIPGRGIRAIVESELHLIGNERLIRESGLILREEVEARRQVLESQGAVALIMAWGGEVKALIVVADKEKSEAKAVISALQAKGVGVHLLSGDSPSAVGSIAEKLGIEHFRANMLPEEKADYIKALKAEGQSVAMIGDGINDSVALAEADLSIAMGTGSDVAIETAQATLQSGDMRKVVELIEVSRLTIRTIKQNLFWAFAYNIVAIPLAAGLLYPLTGWTMTPMIASVLMALSSVSVVINSLRLKK